MGPWIRDTARSETLENVKVMSRTKPWDGSSDYTTTQPFYSLALVG